MPDSAPETVADLPDDFVNLTGSSHKLRKWQRYLNTELPCLYVRNPETPLHSTVYAATADSPGAPLKRLM